MELREQPLRPTLDQKLGDVAHVSPLLRKARQLSGCAEDQVGEWLLKCAVERGATHYERELPAQMPADEPSLTNEEPGVARCLGHLTSPAEMTRFGRAALALGVPDAPPGLHNTRDVEENRRLFLSTQPKVLKLAADLRQ